MKDSVFFYMSHAAIDLIFNLCFFLFFSFKHKLLLGAQNWITGNVLILVGSCVFLSLEQRLGIEAVPVFLLTGENLLPGLSLPCMLQPPLLLLLSTLGISSLR